MPMVPAVPTVDAWAVDSSVATAPLRHSGEAALLDTFWAYLASTMPTAEFAALRAGVAIVDIAVDTACTIFLVQMDHGRCMHNAGPSSLRVRGFCGQGLTSAAQHGRMALWAVAKAGERPPEYDGAYTVPEAHSMGGINSALFSLGKPVNVEKMSLSLNHPAVGPSALIKHRPQGKGTWMPITWSTRTEHWYMQVVYGTTAALCERVGLAFEQWRAAHGPAPSLQPARWYHNSYAPASAAPANAVPASTTAARDGTPSPPRRSEPPHSQERRAIASRASDHILTDLSLERAAETSTAQLVELVMSLKAEHEFYFDIANELRHVPGGHTSMLPHHILNEVWGTVCGYLYDDLDSYPSALMAVGTNFTLDRFSGEELELLCDSEAAELARSALSTHRLVTDAELGMFTAYEQWDGLVRPAAGRILHADWLLLPAMGRIHHEDFFQIAWGPQPADRRLQQWVAGPGVDSHFWDLTGVRGTSMVQHLTEASPLVRAALRRWAAPAERARLHTLRTEIRAMVEDGGPAIKPCAVGIIGTPGSTKSRYVDNMHMREPAPGERRGRHAIQYNPQADCSADLRSDFAGQVAALVNCYPEPVDGAPTVCTSPWTVVAHALALVLDNAIDMRVFRAALADVLARGWLPLGIVAVHTHVRDNITHVRLRGGASDRHLTDDLMASAAAATMVLTDMLQGLCCVRHAYGELNADGLEHFHNDITDACELVLRQLELEQLRPGGEGNEAGPPGPPPPDLEDVNDAAPTTCAGAPASASAVQGTCNSTGASARGQVQGDTVKRASTDTFHNVKPGCLSAVASAVTQYGGEVYIRRGLETMSLEVPQRVAECYDVSAPEPEPEPELELEPEPELPEAEPERALVPGDKHHGGDRLAQLYYECDTDMRAIKQSLPGRMARMTEQAAHEAKGHVPFKADCHDCAAGMAVFKRTLGAVDPFIDRRPCHTFHCDMVTFDVRSRKGRKYLWVMRCGGLFLDGLPLVKKSDLPQAFKEWVSIHRRDALFNKHPWAFCSKVRMDCAAEHLGSEFVAVCNSFDPIVKRSLSDPQSRGNANGVAEVTIRMVECMIRTMLRSRCLEAFMWEDCWMSIRHLRRIVPTRHDLVSSKGDAAPPLELATCHQIDRRTCAYWFKMFEATGTLCLVLVRYKEIGSHIGADRWRFGVVLYCEEDLLVFYNPQGSKNVIFRSKHYMVLRLPRGVPVEEYLGIADATTDRRGEPRMGDFIENQQVTVIQLENVREWAANAGLPDVRPATRAEDMIRTRGVQRPGVVVVDRNYNHWRPTMENGEASWRNCGPLVQQLLQAGAIEPPLPPAPPAPTQEALQLHDRAAPEPVLEPEPALQPEPALEPEPRRAEPEPSTAERLVLDDPKHVVGLHFYKRFGEHGIYKGRVTGFKPRLKLWTVCYDQHADDAQAPDGKKEEFDASDIVHYVIDCVDQPTKHNATAPVPLSVPDPFDVQPGYNQPVWMREALTLSKAALVFSEATWTFKEVCGELSIPSTLFRTYYDWLGSTAFGERAKNVSEHADRLGVHFKMPFNSRGGFARGLTPLPRGTTFPHPTGKRWDGMVAAIEKNGAAAAQASLVEELEREGMLLAREYMRAPCSPAGKVASASAASAGLTPPWRDGDASASATQREHDRHLIESVAYGKADSDEEAALLRYIDYINSDEYAPTTASASGATRDESGTTEDTHPKVVLRQVKTDWPDWDLSAYTVNGRVQPPKNVTEAKSRVDWPRWKDAIDVEYSSLESLNVFHHHVTRAQAARDWGVTTSEIPLRCLLKVSYATDGFTIIKYKARRILIGHEHYAHRGVHYQQTWAPTPDFTVSRLVEGLAASRKYHRIAYDVAVAFVQSKLKRGQWILVRYEKHLITHDAEGNELFAILLRPLYGLGSAPRFFAECRDNWMLTKFNQDGWKCRVSLYEPCLFIMRSPTDQPYLLLVHVDDNLLVGPDLAELKYVRDATHERFVVKDVSPDELLGVARKLNPDGSVTFTQAGFIEHLHAQFAEHLGNRKRDVPFPFNEMLVRGSDEAEHKKYEKLGMRSLAGGLIWAYRMTMPLLGPGVNQVCKCVSAATKRSWDCALHCLEYAYQHRHEGIRLNAPGCCEELIAWYDAGGVRDPTDSKCQHGYLIHEFGGPVSWNTSKQKHISAAGTMGLEFMSQAHCTKETVYLRQLGQDVGYIPRDAPPTRMYGDNLNAVVYGTEQKITANMRHMRECYFLTREWYMCKAILPCWLPGDKNCADVTSKPCSREVIIKHKPRALGFTDDRYVAPPSTVKGSGMDVDYPVDLNRMDRHARELT